MASHAFKLTPKRLRRRLPRPRGAVFVEAIVLCTLFALIMAGAVFFHRLYFTKLKVVEEARAAVWTQAMAGCNQAADLGAIWSAGSNTAGGEIDTDSSPSFFGTISHTEGSSARTVAKPSIVGGDDYPLAVTSRVACHEIPADKRGDIKSIIGYAAANLIPSFF